MQLYSYEAFFNSLKSASGWLRVGRAFAGYCGEASSEAPRA